MSGRPLLFLDVDGVLDPYGYGYRPAGFATHELFDGEEPVLLLPAHGLWITELAGLFDGTWATGGTRTPIA